MTISELFLELSTAGLSLHRIDADSIEIVGDVDRLTVDVKAALAEHKSTLLAALPNPAAKPTPSPIPMDRPWWWSDELSHADNQALDDFMSYDPELGPVGEAEEIILTDGCEQCGSILAWVDLQGNEHCLGHEKPNVRSFACQAVALRERAAERLADPSVSMYGRAKSYRGAKQRARFAGVAR